MIEVMRPQLGRPQKSNMRISANDKLDPQNLDLKVARGFGQEWSTFRQDAGHLSQQQRQEIFDDYFRIFPWHLLPPGGGVGIDIGCGTGRWSMLVAPRGRDCHLLDAAPTRSPSPSRT